jgi:hypothetical protein
VYDLGDTWPLAVEIRNDAGVLTNSSGLTLTITLPDGTSVTPTPTNTGTGTYAYSYVFTQAGRHSARWVSTSPASAFTDSADADEAAPNGIVSLSEVKTHLRIDRTDRDEQLRLYIDAATAYFEHELGPIVRRTITETVPASGGFAYVSGPVISLTSITDAYGYGYTYDVVNYVGDSTGLVRGLTYSSTFAYPVTVTYVGGRAIIPADLKLAALDYIEWRWQDQRGPTPLPAPGGEFEIAAPATVPYKIQQVLDRYRQPVVA